MTHALELSKEDARPNLGLYYMCTTPLEHWAGSDQLDIEQSTRGVLGADISSSPP